MKTHQVLKLKVVAQNGEAEKLGSIAELCRRAKNAAAENWLLRQRGLPETTKQSKRLIKHKSTAGRKEKTESTKLYHASVAAAPELGTGIHSTLAQQIQSYLAAKVDWRARTDTCSKRRDAILSYQDRPPYFTELAIPVRNKFTTIQFDDRLLIHVKNVIRFETLTVELSLKKMTTGLKRIIHDITLGKRRLADSQLILRREKWYWYVPVATDVEPVDSEKMAVLSPTIGDHDWGKFFQVTADGRKRNFGDGNYLKAQTLRLIGLQKQIGWRYRQRRGAGHGRRKIDKAVSKRARQLYDIRLEVKRRLIADVVKMARQQNCGVLVYREPTLPVREKTWFAANGLTFDWTRFRTDLKNSLARFGIEMKLKALKIAEVIDDKKGEDGGEKEALGGIR